METMQREGARRRAGAENSQESQPTTSRRDHERTDATSRRRSIVRDWWKPAMVVLATIAALGAVATRSPAVPEGDATPVVVERQPELALDAVRGIDARAYAVYDSSTGEFLAARDLHGKRSVGSLMKLLTAWVVLEAGEPDRLVTVPSVPTHADESSIGLRPGEKQERDVLLRSMLIVSANDAARALAVDVAGDTASFADRMNEAAIDLGLTATHAVDPAGLDAIGQYSTAHDVVKLGDALMHNRDFRAIVSRRDARLHGEVHRATNDLLGTYVGADGIKTGHTDEAGWCLLASATRGDRQLLALVLGSPTEDARDRDATRLLDWGFAMTSGG